MAIAVRALVKFARASSASACSVYASTQYRRTHCLSVLTQAVIKVDTSKNIQFISARNASFFGKVTGDELWGGVQGVSNAGRKKGRGKGRLKKINLNKGQAIGRGTDRMVWPGLNNLVVKGSEILSIKPLPSDPDRENKIKEIQEGGSQFRRMKVPALRRGWTGAKRGGTSIGPPDPVGDYIFKGFDTRVLEFKMVSNMTGTLGRKQRYSSFVVTGNKNGLAGFALAKAPNAAASLRKAKNMAAQRLRYIERYNGHTVYHNFFSKEQQTSVFVTKVAKGEGLVCHRSIKTMCEVIGIEDLYAKVEGSVNVQNITKAFFAGLQKQETHQQLADRLKLNVVEFRPEMGNVPVVVSRPSEGQTRPEGIKEEGFDFENLYFGGKVILRRRPKVPFYIKMKSWHIKKTFMMKMRNQRQAQLERMALGLEPSLEEKRLRSRPLK